MDDNQQPNDKPQSDGPGYEAVPPDFAGTQGGNARIPGETTKDERMWGMLAHLSSLVALLMGGFSFIGPLVVWFVKKDESEFVAREARESLNFQLTFLIAWILMMLVTFVGAILTFGLAACITIPLMIVIFAADVILTIIAAMKANEGESFSYPFTIQFMK